MSLGRIVRACLGDRHARAAGRAYRALFVDLDKVSAIVAKELPPNAHVLDVGGGDGEHLNGLLALRADIRVSTIDVAPTVGQWIESRHRERVTCLPSTSLHDYAGSGRACPDVLLVSDVMHHIPVQDRESFLATAVGLFLRAPKMRIIVKDVEPAHWRATLGYLSDRYVTGDRTVRPISRSELIAAVRRACSEIRWTETELFATDPPNYSLVFWR